MTYDYTHNNTSNTPVSLNDLIARDKTLTTFIDAYRSIPELVELLEDTSKHVTVIAVTNQAFRALDKIPPMEELARRIKRHFLVNMTSNVDSLHGAHTIDTLSMQPVSITMQNDGRIHTLEGVTTTFVTETVSSALYKVDLLLD
ncbi:hypothetical protein BDF22DRAFT_743150 [Syncephalis plumigaleata]|nr:hypothetical protein BDF22DRAFT_743150 [Syncephalis plumigaleata]